MRRYPGKPKSLLAEWLRYASQDMRDELCKRVDCPFNSIQSLAYGHRKMPRLDRGYRIVTACNEIRQRIIDELPNGGNDTGSAAVIPPLMTVQGLIDGVGNRHDEQN